MRRCGREVQLSLQVQVVYFLKTVYLHPCDAACSHRNPGQPATVAYSAQVPLRSLVSSAGVCELPGSLSAAMLDVQIDASCVMNHHPETTHELAVRYSSQSPGRHREAAGGGQLPERTYLNLMLLQDLADATIAVSRGQVCCSSHPAPNPCDSRLAA
jgi:hypothetical protein